MADLSAARTLPDHDRCDTHRGYKLSCDQYERLIARAGQRCEICRADLRDTSQRKLSIDHSGPKWAVRGLLCTAHNTRLRDGTGWFPGSAEYLARTWWVQECARLGIPTQLAPEPAIGSAIRDQHGLAWIREADGKWHAHGKTRPGVSCLTWQGIYDMRGPQNMAPFDVFGPDGSQTLRWQVEKALQIVSIGEREAAAHERGRMEAASAVLGELSEGDRKQYLEWADDGGWGEAHGEPQSQADQVVDAAGVAMNDIYTDLYALQDRVARCLEALPDSVGSIALRAARTRLFERMGARFTRAQFAEEAVYQLQFAIKFIEARTYLESLPEAQHMAWLEYAASAHSDDLGPVALTVLGANAALKGAEGRVLTWMCHGDGDVISLCSSQAGFSARFKGCCDDGEPHKHPLCESHLAQGADGTLLDKEGQSRTLVDFDAYPEPELAGTPF